MSDGKTSGLKNVYRRWFYRWLAKKYMKGCIVLDVGSGNGFFAKSIKDLVPRVIRIDKNPVDDETIEMNYGGWAEPVDVVFASQFIEHVDAQYFVAWANEVCKKCCVIITPGPSTSFWDDPDHIRPHTPRAIKALLESAGFEVVRQINPWPIKSHITIANKKHEKEKKDDSNTPLP